MRQVVPRYWPPWRWGHGEQPSWLLQSVGIGAGFGLWHLAVRSAADEPASARSVGSRSGGREPLAGSVSVSTTAAACTRLPNLRLDAGGPIGVAARCRQPVHSCWRRIAPQLPRGRKPEPSIFAISAAGPLAHSAAVAYPPANRNPRGRHAARPSQRRLPTE